MATEKKKAIRSIEDSLHEDSGWSPLSKRDGILSNTLESTLLEGENGWDIAFDEDGNMVYVPTKDGMPLYLPEDTMSDRNKGK